MAHCSGTKSSTCTQRFSLWATSVASSSISAPSKVRLARLGPFVLLGLAKLFRSVEHRCVSAPIRPHFASARAKGKRSSQKRLAESRFFKKPSCKHETHLEKEQVCQSVRTGCGGLAKPLAPQKYENAFP